MSFLYRMNFHFRPGVYGMNARKMLVKAIVSLDIDIKNLKYFCCGYTYFLKFDSPPLFNNIEPLYRCHYMLKDANIFRVIAHSTYCILYRFLSIEYHFLPSLLISYQIERSISQNVSTFK